MNFTDISLRKLKLPETGRKIHFDDNLPGFGVRVSKKYKTFVVLHGTPRRYKSLGRYPSVKLSDARKNAKYHLAVDQSLTGERDYIALVLEFLEECKDRNRPETIRQYKRHLKQIEYTGKVGDLTRSILRGHLATLKDRQYAYAHAIAAFRVFFNWCLRLEYIEKNPIVGEPRPALQSRSRVLAPEEIRLVWQYEGHEPFCTLLKLCLLTGQRRTELTYLDTKCVISEDTIVFPPEITKNKREHTIPVTDMVEPLLKQNFLNVNGNPFNAWSKSKKKLDEVVEIPHWTIHDLRRTFATIHAEIGTPIHITERLLNHSSGSVSGIVAVYNKYSYLPQMKEAQENYERCLKEIINET